MELEIPADGDCFYHCLDHFEKKGPQAWRQAVATVLIQQEHYFKSFFTRGRSFQEHVKGVQGGQWADHPDIVAAAYAIQRPIVIFRKGTEQKPTAILPTMPVDKDKTIYLLLDETSAGCEHYSLLVPKGCKSPEQKAEKTI